ncbi:MAG TPA: lipopolysaccharide biosynthesis protein [Leucothrix mucor]|uniref:Lipopolysaccharide biosynthesis protein n=1 Tax=Leucothrix mucor TaxID=45248 RepID=A0A7V2T1F2_LEUMU|nr:lipopolysaccharide biosynthesis protein [Leucothrix mucor]
MTVLKKGIRYLLKIVGSGDGQSQFAKNFLKVVKANIFARALPLLVTPILTRMYAPEDFAALSLFMSILLLASSFSTMKFEWSLPSVDSNNTAVSLISLGLFFLLLTTTSFLLIIILLFAIDSTSLWKGFDIIGLLLYLLPIAVLGLGLKSLLETWHIRANDLTPISYSKVVESSLDVTFSLIGGGLKLMSAGLILAKVVGIWSAVATLLLNTKDLMTSLKEVKRYKLIRVFKRYSKEAFWSSLTSITNTLGFILPLFIFTQLYPTKEVGWYALMNTLALAPVAVFSAALGQSFWSEAAKMARGKEFVELKGLYLKTTYNLSLFSIPAIVVLLLSPFYLDIILGSQWQDASYIMVALIPFVVGKLIFAPTNHLIVLSKQYLQAGCDITRIVLTIIAIVISYKLEFSFFTTVLMTSLASFAGYIVLFLTHLKVHTQYG